MKCSSTAKVNRKRKCPSWEKSKTCEDGPECMFLHEGEEQSETLTPPMHASQMDGAGPAGGSSMRTPQSAAATPEMTLQPASCTIAFPPLVNPKSAPSITMSSATASVSSPSITTSSATASVSSPSAPATPFTVNQTTAPTKTSDAVVSQAASSSNTKETESVPAASEVTAEKILTGSPVDTKTNAELDDGTGVSLPPLMIENPVSSPSITTSFAPVSMSSPTTPATPLTVNQSTAPTKTPDAVVSQAASSSNTKETESVPGSSEVTAEKVLTGGSPVDSETNAELDDGTDVSLPPLMIENPVSSPSITTSFAPVSVSSPTTPATPLTVNQSTAPTKTPDAVVSQAASSSNTKETESVPGSSEVTAEKVLTGGSPVDSETNAELDDGTDVSLPPLMIENPVSSPSITTSFAPVSVPSPTTPATPSMIHIRDDSESPTLCRKMTKRIVIEKEPEAAAVTEEEEVYVCGRCKKLISFGSKLLALVDRDVMDEPVSDIIDEPVAIFEVVYNVSRDYDQAPDSGEGSFVGRVLCEKCTAHLGGLIVRVEKPRAKLPFLVPGNYVLYLNNLLIKKGGVILEAASREPIV